jgi:hypothetical protein
MRDLQSFLAYAPRGAGLLCAAVYAESGDDVYGWFTGNRDYQAVNAFFLLKGFFSVGETVFYSTDGMDLHGGWKYDFSRSKPELDRSLALDEDLVQALDEMRGEFAGEWLFYQNDPNATRQIQAFEELGLPVQAVNVQAKKLDKFDQSDAVWRYYSTSFQHPVLSYLGRRWPLDYRAE